MGLDLSCRCGNVGFRAGSYSGFDWWRNRLAKGLGFDLEKYWSQGCLPETPFKPLLNHSDCDGFLTPKQCRQMIKPMEEFITKRIESLKNPWNIILGVYSKEEEDYFIQKCRDWLLAFRHSSEEDCRLEFG